MTKSTSKNGDRPSSAVRIRVMKRDRFTCTYCGLSGQEAELEVDHIIAVAKGGSHHMSNLTTACRSCNQKKGAGTLSRQASKSNGNQNHRLVGLYLHTIENGRIQYQGKVLSVDDGVALVQLFSFLDGRPTNVTPMTVAEIYACKIYTDRLEWIRAHLVEMRNEGRLNLGTVEEVLALHEKGIF